ncbi:hypothetical protein HOI83_02095 [Candidatus Uhrbacteria bacterium]|jgi:anionic cell wall polymer biosynthesis LytR-Cps2A-Psr (LCP) family protein|nr:hypothetical protein [Candidatus Uhrbacteria bacterium]
MKAARYIKWSAISIGAVVLFLLFFSHAMCPAGQCSDVSGWSISGDIARMLGFYEDVELPDEVNVLVIGVDSRKGSDTVHCDAIHMVHIDLVDETMHFVNVPRGTFSYIPGQPPEEQYLANVCDYIDVDTFVERVNVITGYEADYRVQVGFSQAQGLLRALDFNPTTTLQYLRHRQSYAIGDPQRSYNQSIFLSDLVMNRMDIVDSIPLPARFALFKLVDTDMSHSFADALYSWLANSDIPGDTERITHATKPAWTPVAFEMRFDEENAEEQLQSLHKVLRYYDPSFKVSDLQSILKNYIDEHVASSYSKLVNGDLVGARESLDFVTDQQLWHQVEDASSRKELMVEVAVLDSSIVWYESYQQDRALGLATTLIGLLELEEESAPSILKIKTHLTELLEDRT